MRKSYQVDKRNANGELIDYYMVMANSRRHAFRLYAKKTIDENWLTEVKNQRLIINTGEKIYEIHRVNEQ
mgnify:CR=1 FL=1